MAVATDKKVSQDAVETPVASALPAAMPLGALPSGEEDPAGRPQLGPARGEAGLRAVGKIPTTEEGEPEDLERADIVGGEWDTLEGKQRPPRRPGSDDGARWR
jgi:hypothetical protein